MNCLEIYRSIFPGDSRRIADVSETFLLRCYAVIFDLVVISSLLFFQLHVLVDPESKLLMPFQWET